jgi:integration host factor subunit beta
MTKAQLIAEVGQVPDMTQRDSELTVEAVFDAIVRSLRGGATVEIRGFGSFRIRQRASRIARNPKTGARVDVPAKRVAFFKPGKELKELLQKNAQPPATPEVHGEKEK